jgi:PAS domain S-box-containing protein
MAAELRTSGIAPLGDIPWGTHVCHFYETGEDLLETIAAFFAAGLAARELCFFLTADPAGTSELSRALRTRLPGFDDHVAGGALQITSAPEWYRTGPEGRFDGCHAVKAWDETLDEALKNGYAGLRATGGQSWLDPSEWNDFRDYESMLEASMKGKPMLVLCSYSLAIGAGAVLDIARSHRYVLTRRKGEWQLLETAELQEARDEIRRLNEELQQRVEERTAQLNERNRQQSALVKLGQIAVRERGLEVLMSSVTELAAETLGTGRSIIWQLQPNGHEFALRAQTGWSMLPSGATFTLEPGSAAGYVIQNDAPVVVDDLRSESRVKSWILRDHDVVTMISTVIRAREGPWGMLSVHSLTPRSFTPDDVEFLQSLANILALAIERNAIEQAERREREALQTIFDHSPVMISVYDASEQLVYANRAWEQTLGFTTQEAQQTNFYSALFRDAAREDEARAIGRLANGRWTDLELTTRNGHAIHATWARFRLSDGTSIGFGLDVTERTLAEREQAAARQTAETALAKLHAIESITDAALSRMALDEMLDELLARVSEALGTPIGLVTMYDEERGDFVIRASAGFPPARARGKRLPAHSPISGAVMREGRAMTFNDLPPPDSEAWNGQPFPELNPSAAMAAPLIAQGRFIGTVGVTSLTPRVFTNNELDLLRVVADRVAPAIERSRLAETIRAGSERLEALSRRLLAVQEEERRRLAVELHDELGQLYTAIKIKLGSVQRRLGEHAAAAELSEAMEIVDRAVGTARDLALDLRPAMLDDLGLPAALRWYADRFAQQTGIEIHLALQAVQPAADVAIACFRVAQEALTNVARHANARNVRIELRDTDGALELAVRDDGAGFNVRTARDEAVRGATLGILGMEERVSLVRGTLHIASTPGTGTAVTARFPREGAA